MGNVDPAIALGVIVVLFAILAALVNGTRFLAWLRSESQKEEPTAKVDIQDPLNVNIHPRFVTHRELEEAKGAINKDIGDLEKRMTDQLHATQKELTEQGSRRARAIYDKIENEVKPLTEELRDCGKSLGRIEGILEAKKNEPHHSTNSLCARPSPSPRTPRINALHGGEREDPSTGGDGNSEGTNDQASTHWIHHSARR